MTSPPNLSADLSSPGSGSQDLLNRQTGKLRLAVVTRRFWPFSGTTEMAVGDLVSSIKKIGHDVDLFTIRWEKNWPAYFQFQEFPVHRVNRPLNGPWGSFRYLRTLARQLVEVEPDGIIVNGLGDEAWSIGKKFANEVPLVIRLDNHQFDDTPKQSSLTTRQIAALNSAASVVVDSQWTADKVGSHPAVNSDSICIVPEGISVSEDHKRTLARQGSSRAAISDAHPVLMIESAQPLVVCGSPLNGDAGMLDLIDAWPRVLARFPMARLWILGDGKEGRTVWDRLLDRHVVNSVIMPGSFDDLTNVFQAADVYVHPLRSDESCGFLARALAHGVCSVVTANKSSDSKVENNVTGLVVDSESPRAMADAMILALSNSDLRDRLGRAALKSAKSAYDIKRMVQPYIEPFFNRDTAPSKTNIPSSS